MADNQLMIAPVLPNDKDLEEVIVGICMLERDGCEKACTLLIPENFATSIYREMFSAIKDIHDSGEIVDMLTVTNRLKERKTLDQVGGPYTVSCTTSRVSGSANIEVYCRIISQNYLKRKLILISHEIIRKASDESIDVFEAIGIASSEIEKINSINWKGSKMQDTSFLLDQILDDIKSRKDNPEKIAGIICGVYEADRITMGWQQPDMIVLAARPSVGKTAFALFCLLSAVLEDYPVAFFTIEMSKKQLLTRLAAMLAKVDMEKFKSGNLSEEEMQRLEAAIKKIKSLSHLIHIEDLDKLDISDYKIRVRSLKKEKGIVLCVVDYIQLMSDRKYSGNREQEISHVSRGLKSSSKELNIATIAISQLSRAVEARTGDFRPKLKDLRESGSIEQDADVVVFLMRPEYHGDAYANAIASDEGIERFKGMTHFNVAKNRNGKIGWCFIQFIEEHQLFKDPPANATIFQSKNKEQNEF